MWASTVQETAAYRSMVDRLKDLLTRITEYARLFDKANWLIRVFKAQVTPQGHAACTRSAANAQAHMHLAGPG